MRRKKQGKFFSIVAVAEGAMSKEFYSTYQLAEETKETQKVKDEKKKAKYELSDLKQIHSSHAIRLAQKLQELTKQEARVTILGHLQRGGTPSAADRLLATRLGTACCTCLRKEEYGVMIGVQNDETVTIPLEKVIGKLKLVPLDHSWIDSARRVGTCLGDE
jgi:ATP-dependent phosphofructokinase / diphosphate-dependent phosphofructokinase